MESTLPRGAPTKAVPVRLTDEDRAKLEAAAKAAGQALAPYMRDAALEKAGVGGHRKASGRHAPTTSDGQQRQRPASTKPGKAPVVDPARWNRAATLTGPRAVPKQRDDS